MTRTGTSSKWGRRCNMANLITGVRILCSLALLFFPAFSPAFYTLYVAAGVSDMIDGTVARITGTAGAFGSKLDTVADFVLVCCCLIKLLPILHLPTWLMLWIIGIAVIKAIDLISGYVLHKELAAVHTVMNKVTGLFLFLLPLTLPLVDLRYSGAFVSAAATFAAVQEGCLIQRKGKLYGTTDHSAERSVQQREIHSGQSAAGTDLECRTRKIRGDLHR